MQGRLVGEVHCLAVRLQEKWYRHCRANGRWCQGSTVSLSGGTGGSPRVSAMPNSISLRAVPRTNSFSPRRGPSSSGSTCRRLRDASHGGVTRVSRSQQMRRTSTMAQARPRQKLMRKVCRLSALRRQLHSKGQKSQCRLSRRNSCCPDH